VTTAKASEPLSKWELMQEAIERKRLREMDDAFCASLTAAINRGEEKELNAQVRGSR
jgi:hypothetical protein